VYVSNYVDHHLDVIAIVRTRTSDADGDSYSQQASERDFQIIGHSLQVTRGILLRHANMS
jgi:hypothetical protein